MRIYFHIDEVARDAIVASVLRKELLIKGHTIFYGNRSTSTFLKKFSFIFANSFDIIIMPRVHFFEGFETFSAYKIILYTESIGRAVSFANKALTSLVLLDKKFVEGNTKSAKDIDQFMCWGNNSLDFIRAYHPEFIEKFVVVGHPRFDKRALPAKRKDVSQLPRVGIITRQCILNEFANRALLDSIVENAIGGKCMYKDKLTGEQFQDQDNAIPERLFMEAREIELYLEIIRQLNEKSIDVEIRIHPRENRLTWKKLIRTHKLPVSLCDWDKPFSHFLGEIDYIIGPASTSFYDAFRLSVKPILINNIDPRLKQFKHPTCEDNNPLMDEIFAPTNVQDLVSKIEDQKETIVNKSNIDRILSYEANLPCSQNAVSCIAKELDQLKYLNRRRSKPILSLVLAPILIKWGLLGILRSVLMLFKSKPEQSSSFSLHPSRIIWINRLSNENTK